MRKLLLAVPLLLACADTPTTSWTFNVVCEPTETGGQACSGNVAQGSEPAPPVVEFDAQQPPPVVADAAPVIPDASSPGGWGCIAGTGTDYQVGPAFAAKRLADVPWTALGPGDTVRIHWSPEPYRERVLVSTKGTAAAPIKICGVPGPDGQRPVIDGQNSVPVDSAGFRKPEHTVYGLILFYASAGQPWDNRPEYVVVEGLELRNAWKAYGFAEGAAGVRIIDGGDHITVRNNVIRSNSNGVLQSSGGSGNHLSEYLVVEYNEFVGNGGDTTDRSRSHAMYIQGYRPLVQGNYIHNPRTPGESTGIKDRSPGSVIRYNWVDTDTIALDLVEPQEHNAAVVGMPEYHTAHVYGNVLIFRGDGRVVHFGGDVGMGNRKGPLYFYNNTVHIIVGDRTWSNSLIDVDDDDGTAYAYNNVVWRDKGRSDGLGVTLVDRNGTLYVQNNFVGPKWALKKDANYPSTVVGADTTITVPSVPWGADYTPASPLLNAAIPLRNGSLPVELQYKTHAETASRKSVTTVGAFE